LSKSVGKFEALHSLTLDVEEGEVLGYLGPKSFLIELVGSVVNGSRLLLDTSVLSHITPASAANPDWTAVAGLVGLGLVGAAIGLVGFSRRDRAGA
jgi:putative exporter of polyketide antibiotics